MSVPLFNLSQVVNVALPTTINLAGPSNFFIETFFFKLTVAQTTANDNLVFTFQATGVPTVFWSTSYLIAPPNTGRSFRIDAPPPLVIPLNSILPKNQTIQVVLSESNPGAFIIVTFNVTAWGTILP